MGTPGAYSYGHRGRYYMIHSPSDNFPFGLGEDLVQSIPKDPAEFDTWRAEKVNWLDKLWQTETDKCSPIPVQAPVLPGFIPAVNAAAPDEALDTVYAEYFWRMFCL
jgi:hypothetical protein